MYRTVTLPIDERHVTIRIRALTVAEFEAFQTQFFAYGFNGSQTRGTLPDGVAEDPAEAAAKAREHDLQCRAWVAQVFADYVRVPFGALTETNIEDEGLETEREVQVPVTTGTSLLRLYGNREDILPAILALIWGENRLTEAQKKTWRSRLVSNISSLNTPLTVALGLGPVSTAAPVAPSSSAAPEDATASSGAESSSIPDQSSSEPAPS